MELAPSRVGASEQVLSADATDPDASPHAQSQESQILCEKCQTLAIEKDKLVRPPHYAWVMELFYERHDAFPDFQELRSAISARCPFCNYLSSILEGIIEKELEGKGRISEIKAKGCFSGSVPFVVKISRWVFWVPKSEEDGILPSRLEGQISFGTAKKILEFGVSTEAGELTYCTRHGVSITRSNYGISKVPGYANIRSTLRKGCRKDPKLVTGVCIGA
jgi:hypothetical protein